MSQAEFDGGSGQIRVPVNPSPAHQTHKTEAEVAATHTGALPDTLPELVPLIALALLADPERLWSMQVWD